MRRNNAGLMATLLSGAILGVLPFALYIKDIKKIESIGNITSTGSEFFFIVYISVVLVITFVGIFRVKIDPTATPRITDYGFAALGILCFHAIVGLTGFVSYLGLYWGIIKLVRPVAKWIGWEVSSGHPYSIAFWPSAMLTLLLGGIYAFASVDSVSRALVSAKTGVRSTYSVMLHGRMRLGIQMFYYPVAALIIYGIVVFAFKNRTALLLASQLLLFFVGLLPMQLLQSSPGSPIKREAILAITKLAQAFGYSVIDSPRTKDLGVDTMLEGTDLLLSKGQQAWLVEIKTSLRTAEQVQSWDVSALPLASKALSKFINKDEKAPITVKPVLVLIGRSPSGGLEALTKEGNLRLVRFENMASVLKILKINDETILREKATSYFGKEFTSADA